MSSPGVRYPPYLGVREAVEAKGVGQRSGSPAVSVLVEPLFC
jgi:hypothetical protein